MLKKLSVLFSFLLWGYIGIAQDFPAKSNTLVTDYTNTLSPADKQRLENKLVAFDDSSSTQIAVVILKSVGDYDINQYGQQLGRKWGIGQKGTNNGIIVLVAIDDHKMTIQVGYGLEGALPDVIALQIQRTDMDPRFKTGDYYGGLDAGTDDIIKYTKGEYKADPNKMTDQSDGDGFPVGLVIFIVVIILIIIFRNRGGGGHMIGRGSSPLWWLFAGSMLGGGGRGWGGGGNDGDSGGGGFGGFGGGDFGGGGASSSW